MLRRAASGHIEATQLSKFAAASRIALAVIRGWPEAPSSPLQGGAPLPGVGCAGVSDFGPEKMLPSRLEIPLPDDCAFAPPGSTRAAATSTAIVRAFTRGSIRRRIYQPLPQIRASGRF